MFIHEASASQCRALDHDHWQSEAWLGTTDILKTWLGKAAPVQVEA